VILSHIALLFVVSPTASILIGSPFFRDNTWPFLVNHKILKENQYPFASSISSTCPEVNLTIAFFLI